MSEESSRPSKAARKMAGLGSTADQAWEWLGENLPEIAKKIIQDFLEIYKNEPEPVARLDPQAVGVCFQGCLEEGFGKTEATKIANAIVALRTYLDGPRNIGEWQNLVQALARVTKDPLFHGQSSWKGTKFEEVVKTFLEKTLKQYMGAPMPTIPAFGPLLPTAPTVPAPRMPSLAKFKSKPTHTRAELEEMLVVFGHTGREVQAMDPETLNELVQLYLGHEEQVPLGEIVPMPEIPTAIKSRPKSPTTIPGERIGERDVGDWRVRFERLKYLEGETPSWRILLEHRIKTPQHLEFVSDKKGSMEDLFKQLQTIRGVVETINSTEKGRAWGIEPPIKPEEVFAKPPPTQKPAPPQKPTPPQRPVPPQTPPPIGVIITPEMDREIQELAPLIRKYGSRSDEVWKAAELLAKKYNLGVGNILNKVRLLPGEVFTPPKGIQKLSYEEAVKTIATAFFDKKQPVGYTCYATDKELKNVINDTAKQYNKPILKVVEDVHGFLNVLYKLEPEYDPNKLCVPQTTTEEQMIEDLIKLEVPCDNCSATEKVDAIANAYYDYMQVQAKEQIVTPPKGPEPAPSSPAGAIATGELVRRGLIPPAGIRLPKKGEEGRGLTLEERRAQREILLQGRIRRKAGATESIREEERLMGILEERVETVIKEKECPTGDPAACNQFLWNKPVDVLRVIAAKQFNVQNASEMKKTGVIDGILKAVYGKIPSSAELWKPIPETRITPVKPREKEKELA